MTTLYSIDVRLCATAYIVADSEEEAMNKARDYFSGACGELPTGEADFIVSGESYNPDMPEVSLSPAVTFDPIPEGEVVQFVEDLDGADEGESEA